MVINKPAVNVPQEVALRKSQRQKRSTIDEYLVYFHESEIDLGIDNDPISFLQAIESNYSDRWINAMKDQLKSIEQNEVQDLVELPEGCKRVRCKGVFKTKRDSTGNIERHKARLVVKGFTQKDGINYKEITCL